MSGSHASGGSKKTRKRRPSRTPLDIRAAIIEHAALEGATLNGIVTSVNLNRKVARRFIDRLVTDGFLRVNDESDGPFVIYSATAKGIKWLKDYRSLVDPSRPNTSS